MRVIKRSNILQNVSFDKITARIQYMCKEAKLDLDASIIAQKVCARIYDGIKTSEIDELTSQVCTTLVTENIQYGKLAAYIIVSNNHKNTSPSFSESMTILYNNCNCFPDNEPLDISNLNQEESMELISQNEHQQTCTNTNHTHILSDEFYNNVIKNKNKYNSVIKYDRDYLFDYFGFKTLEKSYLLKINNKIVERPQHLLMRVCVGIHGDDRDAVIQSYNFMSQKYFIHATPTLYNAGTIRPQLSSCFLMQTGDSVDQIYKTITDCAKISKFAGGIGVNISNIRAKNSIINSTNGFSSGIIPMLQVFNATARYINQAGKRLGSFAMYIEPWHADIFPFLEIRKNHGNEDTKARDLFTALWIPDLFMKRVNEDSKWSLFCPNEAPGLTELYGDEFEQLYADYESKNLYRKQIPARNLWYAILSSHIESGTPYMLYKDAVNRKSNQKNVGIIKLSNLCSEITLFTSDTETAVCNLASISLPQFVEYDSDNKPYFNYDKLHEVSGILTNNLNKVINVNFYPIPETKTSNFRHRPIGIGVQGLADTFILLRMAFDSDEAKAVNKLIFETIYHSALTRSCELSKDREAIILKYKSKNPSYLKKKIKNILPDEINRDKYTGSYSTFIGSPIHNGQFQFDMWDITPSDKWDWKSLKNNIQKYGIRNAALIALMPTASTSQILGNNECFEPYTSNIYVRRTLAGEFIVINKHLINDLTKLGIWSTKIKDKIISNNGSIQNIVLIPDDIKKLYKTVWEIKQKHLIDMSADRGPYIDHSQSLNLFIEKPTFKILSSMNFYAWQRGLKTGQYYLRSKPVAEAQQVTIDPTKKREYTEEEILDCERNNPDGCELCSG